MSPSDDFRAALRAGQPEEAFLLAMSRATELQVTTWVVPAGEAAAHASQPGRRLRTRLNLLQGDIENEVGERFLRDRNYQELRPFHRDQVGKGSEIVAQNIEGLRRLFSAIQALQNAAAPDRPPALDASRRELTYRRDLAPVEEPDADLPPSADWTPLPDAPAEPSEPATLAAELIPPAPAALEPPAARLTPDDRPAPEPAQHESAAEPPTAPPAAEVASAADWRVESPSPESAAASFEPEPEPEPPEPEFPDPWQGAVAESEADVTESGTELAEAGATEASSELPFDQTDAGDRAEPPSVDDRDRALDSEALNDDAPLTFNWDDLDLDDSTEPAGARTDDSLNLAGVEAAVDADIAALFRDLEGRDRDEERAADEPAVGELIQAEEPAPVTPAEADASTDDVWGDFVAFVEAKAPDASESAGSAPEPVVPSADLPDLAENVDWGEWYADEATDAASDTMMASAESPEPMTTEPFPTAREEDWENFTPAPFDPNASASTTAAAAPPARDSRSQPEPASPEPVPVPPSAADDPEDEWGSDFFSAHFLVDEASET